MIKFRKEDFGYIYSPSYGKIRVFSHDAEPFLDMPPEALVKYEIDSFKIPKEQFHLKAPVYVFLEVTQKCNLNCKHCYNTSGSARKNELSTEEYLCLLDELAKLKVFCVFFTGGEPLLRNDIVELISYAGSLGLEVGVITNGTLITEKLIEKIPGNIVFGVSLDGIESHKRMRGGVSFNDIVKKTRILKNANRYFTLLTTVNKENIDELEDIFNWSLKNEVVFSIQDCLPVGRAKKNMRLLLDESDMAKIARLVVLQERVEENLGMIFKKKNFPRSHIDDYFDFVYRLEYATRRCKGGRAVAYVTSDGNIFPCSNCSATGLYMAGNIRRNSFKDIWDNSFRDIRDIKWQHFNQCKTCDVANKDYFCEFRCPALSKNLHNDPFICGATPYIQKSILLKSLLNELMKENISKDELLKHIDNAGYENIIEILEEFNNSRK